MYIDVRFEGKIALFCEGADKTPALISQILSSSSQKIFGEKLARGIEHSIELPIGWLDVPKITLEATGRTASEELFLLAVQRGLVLREIPSHIMQTVIFLLENCPKRESMDVA